MAHAILSPSSASRWLRCPGSVALHSQDNDTGSEFAAEGTAAHEVAEMALTAGTDAAAYVGRVIDCDPWHITVTDEMAAYVQQYLDLVRSVPGQLLVEQRLPISDLTGEADSYGTSDAVVLAADELVIVDLKYGRGIKVDAERNDQLAIYAAAALAEYEFMGDFERVRMIIVQPRLDHVSEWAVPVEPVAGQPSLRSFIDRARDGAARAGRYIGIKPQDVAAEDLNPGDKQCQWCNAKATCPALTRHVLDTVADDFVDLGQPVAPQLEAVTDRTVDNALLGNLLGAVDLIESWCKAIRDKAAAELFAGRPVPGYKLVEGRRGARKWSDATEVEAAFKSFRLKTEEMYDLTLISPTTAEKLHKSGVIGPRQWPKLQAFIAQGEGRPSVVPESDKRPAISTTADEFDTVGA